MAKAVIVVGVDPGDGDCSWCCDCMAKAVIVVYGKVTYSCDCSALYISSKVCTQRLQI